MPAEANSRSTTFMVTQDPYLVRFVEAFHAAQQGRAYLGSRDLGSYLFVDFAQNRKRRVQ